MSDNRDLRFPPVAPDSEQEDLAAARSKADKPVEQPAQEQADKPAADKPAADKGKKALKESSDFLREQGVK